MTKIGLIGGSGIENRLEEEVGLRNKARAEVSTPFGAPSSPLVSGRISETEVVIIQRHGPGHVYPPHKVPYQANIYALKEAAVTHIVATGAVGSLREEIVPGSPVLCDDLIDRTTGRPRTFYDDAAAHVEFSRPFCHVTRKWLLDAASASGMPLRDSATYLALDGPTFSTRAESHMHRAWGADVVGMTAAPEAHLAREAEIAYAMLALPTDYDCWRDKGEKPGESIIENVLKNLATVTQAAISLIAQALTDTSQLDKTPSPAHTALDLGLWTKREHLSRETLDRMGPLWRRRLGEDSA